MIMMHDIMYSKLITHGLRLLLTTCNRPQAPCGPEHAKQTPAARPEAPCGPEQAKQAPAGPAWVGGARAGAGGEKYDQNASW